jgi:UDP-N-acetylglucosamine--N-acetylmuramyl-(pentapeptide) pyrophosphoryl-undecaprenol N-acetylglucosamine transferase
MVEEQQLRCLIATGGTAGHVLPSLAVADELRSRGVHVTLAGSPDRVEAQLVPEAGYELDTFRITGLPRRPSPELARAVLLAGRAPRACSKILAHRRPDVVLGGGGYVAGPMVYAAWRKRIPAALTEADAHLGLANRLSARFARRVFLSYDIATRSGPKYRVVGRPIPEVARAWDRERARAELGLPADGPVLLIAGARAGARALNELAVEAFGASGPAVLHVSGERDYESLRDRVTRPDYKLVPLLDGLGSAYGAADLAITRSGGAVWELAAAGLPAILVPYPFATADHQTLNARYFERAGGAIVVPELELGTVPDLARSLLDDNDRLGRMSDRMRSLALPDAARDIAEELIELARSARG